MATAKPLPDLHAVTLNRKNFKRLQKDGGRAWIKDSQLQPTIKNAHLGIQTSDRLANKS